MGTYVFVYLICIYPCYVVFTIKTTEKYHWKLFFLSSDATCLHGFNPFIQCI